MQTITRFALTAAVATLSLAACHRQNTNGGTGEVAPSDSAQNQTQSGVVDSTGQSTLGPKVEKTSPTQGAPVTSKGDTLKQGGDTVQASPQPPSDSMSRDTTMRDTTSF